MEWWQTRRFRMTLAAGAATLVAVIAGQALSRPFMASCWLASELEHLRRDPDSVEARQVRRWTQLGDAGLLALIDLLQEEEPPLRQAARTALRNEWNSWRLLDDEERDRRTLLALERFAAHGEAKGPEEAELLAEWATETLARRVDPDRAGRLTLACQQALKRSDPSKGSLSELESTIASSDHPAATSPVAAAAKTDLPAELVAPAKFRPSSSTVPAIRSAGLDLPQIR